MGKKKDLIPFQVKVRLCSGVPALKIKPPFLEGIVLANNAINAEKTAIRIITQDLRKGNPEAYAEPFRTVKLRNDFIFNDKDKSNDK